MMLVPGGNVEVVYLAEPDVSVTVAKTFVPFRNWTLPVGVPAKEKTTTVKVTGLPCTEGLMDESRVVVVVALPTTCDSVLEVLPVKLESPP